MICLKGYANYYRMKNLLQSNQCGFHCCSKNEQDKKKDNVVACANHRNIKAVNK